MVAVVVVMLVVADVVTVGAVYTRILCVPPAATEPQVVGEPVNVRLEVARAEGVMECPVTPDAEISVVTQK